MFTLCDGTDRAIITVTDAVVVGSALVSDNLIITCTNTGSTVRLKVRYDVIDRNIVRETVTTQVVSLLTRSFSTELASDDHESCGGVTAGLCTKLRQPGARSARRHRRQELLHGQARDVDDHPSLP